jgi:hypothetical protein
MPVTSSRLVQPPVRYRTMGGKTLDFKGRGQRQNSSYRNRQCINQ